MNFRIGRKKTELKRIVSRQTRNPSKKLIDNIYAQFADQPDSYWTIQNGIIIDDWVKVLRIERGV